MKHSYRVECECHRCAGERGRRAAQSANNPQHAQRAAEMRRSQAIRRERLALRRKGPRRPVVGSQEWAETRGDDLGESPDY